MSKPRLDQGPDYERGFIDGMQYQMQSSVDKAVNAMAQPEQEPVAWYYEIDGSKAISFAKDGEPNKPWQGLYTQPDPDALHAAYMSGFYDGKKAERRERSDRWIGLTDEDKAELDEKYGDDTLAHLDATEAKLKERNT